MFNYEVHQSMFCRNLKSIYEYVEVTFSPIIHFSEATIIFDGCSYNIRFPWLLKCGINAFISWNCFSELTMEISSRLHACNFIYCKHEISKFEKKPTNVNSHPVGSGWQLEISWQTLKRLVGRSSLAIVWRVRTCRVLQRKSGCGFFKTLPAKYFTS